MRGKKTVQIALIVLLAVAVVGFAMSRSSVLKATDAGDANYGETVATGEEEAPAGVTEYLTIPEASAETEPQETEAPAEVPCSVEIAVAYAGGEFQGLGTEVIMTAVTTGYEAPTFQWEVNDGNGWNAIENATESTYSIVVDETNYTWQWRVTVEG